jgi:hypothetical protein
VGERHEAPSRSGDTSPRIYPQAEPYDHGMLDLGDGYGNDRSNRQSVKPSINIQTASFRAPKRAMAEAGAPHGIVRLTNELLIEGQGVVTGESGRPATKRRIFSASVASTAPLQSTSPHFRVRV